MNQRINKRRPKPKNLTEIAVILDRSGSMASIKDDMEGGLWALITEQHGGPGKCRVSVYEFDDEFEVRYEARDAGSLRPKDLHLVPRGTTALNDAVVKALSAIEARVLDEAETARPQLVSVVVITDGQENASTENTQADAHAAIKRAADKFGWQFAFLAADAEGFAEGHAMTKGVDNTSVGLWERGEAREAATRYSASVMDVRTQRGTSVDVRKRRKPGR